MSLRLLLLVPVLVLIGCSNADTLGDQPPVEVVVTGSPTYAGGIGELLTLKCGYCHAYPLPDLAPDNIVTDLDLTVYETRVVDGHVVRGADAIGRFLQDGLLDHEVNRYVDARGFPTEPRNVRQMPLDYGTPVTDAEKDALEEWAELGLPRDDSPVQLAGDANAGLLRWGDCNYCHGLQGEGLLDGDGPRYRGPELEHEAVTISKIKSMWLWSQAFNPNGVSPMSDQDAADLRAFLFELLGED